MKCECNLDLLHNKCKNDAFFILKVKENAPRYVGNILNVCTSCLERLNGNKYIEVIKLNEPEDIFPAYEKAYNRTDGKSTLIVEISDFLGEK